MTEVRTSVEIPVKGGKHVHTVRIAKTKALSKKKV